MPRRLDITISDKANELLSEYRDSTGFGDDSRVIEEALFTIHEMIQVVKDRDKTRTDIPVDRFVGIISTWRRFERKEGY